MFLYFYGWIELTTSVIPHPDSEANEWLKKKLVIRITHNTRATRGYCSHISMRCVYWTHGSNGKENQNTNTAYFYNDCSNRQWGVREAVIFRRLDLRKCSKLSKCAICFASHIYIRSPRWMLSEVLSSHWRIQIQSLVINWTWCCLLVPRQS